MKSGELFDAYLEGKLSPGLEADFLNRLSGDVVFSKSFEQHKELLQAIRSHASHEELRLKLKTIHQSEFGVQGTILPLRGEETFARRHGKTIAIAASTALFVVFLTVILLSAGGYLLRKQGNEITELKRDVIKLRASNNGIVEGITKSKAATYAPANIEGSAFALNNEGYVITSYHLIHHADSVFLKNSALERTAAVPVLTDAKLDLAVLKIEDNNRIKNWNLPYSFKSKCSDIGEKVFTLGYPNNEVVYGEGALSALNGYMNDTSMYQVSVPMNPGNSGGPLLDESGNIIGIIRGKNSAAEATGFAVKSAEIMAFLLRSEKSEELQIHKNKIHLIRGLKRPEQIKKINPYVFNVLIYKKD